MARLVATGVRGSPATIADHLAPHAGITAATGEDIWPLLAGHLQKPVLILEGTGYPNANGRLYIPGTVPSCSIDVRCDVRRGLILPVDDTADSRPFWPVAVRDTSILLRQGLGEYEPLVFHCDAIRRRSRAKRTRRRAMHSLQGYLQSLLGNIAVLADHRNRRVILQGD